MKEIYPISGYQVLPGVTIRINEADPNKPMFVARDVAVALGYKNSADAVQKHCVHRATIAKRDGGFITLIPEGDVYRLIVRSKLPAAQEFERKVFDEILPEIRKTGGYIPAKQGESDETIMARALLIAEKKMQLLELDNTEMHQKLDYATVDAYRALHKGEYWTHGKKTKLGKRATQLCLRRGIEVVKERRSVEVKGYGPKTCAVSVYPTTILDEAYASMQGAA